MLSKQGELKECGPVQMKEVTGKNKYEKNISRIKFWADGSWDEQAGVL